MIRPGRLTWFSCLAVAATVVGPPRLPRVVAADNLNAKTEVNQAAWTESYDEALTKAKTAKKLVLADFTGSDWCHFCVQLKKEVLDTPEFKKWAADHVVLLELDYPRRKKQAAEIKKQNARLKDEFKITGYPTVVLLNADGKEAGRIVGYGGAKEWSAELQKVAKR